MVAAIRGEDTDLNFYEMICSSPRLSIYEYSKLTNWSYGKTQQSAKRLEELGLIKSQTVIGRNRAKKLLIPINWKELYKESVIDAEKDFIEKEVLAV